MTDTRFDLGLKKLNEIDGKQGQQVVNALQDICPDLARYVIEFPFGDIYPRPGLDLKTRELITVSSLTAMGHCLPQLKVHLHGALNVGCSKDEITETILQMAVYAGFPAALNAMFMAKEVFAERGLLKTEKHK